MYLFFDTETTGLPKNWEAPVEDLNNWPRLVQLAYLVYDENGNKNSSGDLIIKPNGFTIPTSASKIHGITTEKAYKEGHTIQSVLQHFEKLIQNATFLVAHNMSFDEKIIGSEFLRIGMKNPMPSKKKICTMESTSKFCAIDGPYGYKWPKLSELYYKLFKVNFVEAHNAFIDIDATAKCFWELKRRNFFNLKLPKITPKIINKNSNNSQINMELQQQAQWLRGFIDSLSYSDNISKRQIEILSSKVEQLIESIENIEFIDPEEFERMKNSNPPATETNYYEQPAPMFVMRMERDDLPFSSSEGGDDLPF